MEVEIDAARIEIAEQAREAGIAAADVLVCCGGGGLSAGVALALEALAPDLRALAQSLADEVRAAAGRAPVPLPELGEATLLDQLRVTVYDATTAGQTDGLPDRLRALRRAIG